MWHKIICYIFALIVMGGVYSANAINLPVLTGGVVHRQTFEPTPKSVQVKKVSEVPMAQNSSDKSFLDDMPIEEFKKMVFDMLDWIKCFGWFLVVWTLIKRWLYLKSSAINRMFFVIDILLYHIISAVLIHFSLQYTLDSFAVAVGIALLFADCYFIKAWRACPQFPYQPDDNDIRTNKNNAV